MLPNINQLLRSGLLLTLVAGCQNQHIPIASSSPSDNAHLPIYWQLKTRHPEPAKHQTRNFRMDSNVSQSLIEAEQKSHQGLKIQATLLELLQLHPIVECVQNNGDGTYKAYWGYQNDNGYSVSHPIGLGNRFTTAPTNQGQPTTFLNGRQSYVFSNNFPDLTTLRWNLGFDFDIATTASTPCAPIITPRPNKVLMMRINVDDFSSEWYYSSIMVADPDGANATTLVPFAATGPWNPTWSPDGTKVLFAENQTANGLYDLYRIDVGGTNKTLLTNTASYVETNASWSPDGNYIMYQSYTVTGGAYNRVPANSDIYVATYNHTTNVMGTPTNVTAVSDATNTKDDTWPVWSPYSNKIAFARDGVIYTVNRDGSSATATSATGLAPHWSSDGLQISYTDSSGQAQILTISSNTSAAYGVPADRYESVLWKLAGGTDRIAHSDRDQYPTTGFLGELLHDPYLVSGSTTRIRPADKIIEYVTDW